MTDASGAITRPVTGRERPGRREQRRRGRGGDLVRGGWCTRVMNPLALASLSRSSNLAIDSDRKFVYR